MLIDPSITPEEQQSFEAELNKLETKYLEKYLNMVHIHITEQTKWHEKIDTIYSKLIMNEHQWWINTLKYEDPNSNHLVRKIQDEIKASYFQSKAKNHQQIDEIIMK